MYVLLASAVIASPAFAQDPKDAAYAAYRSLGAAEYISENCEGVRITEPRYDAAFDDVVNRVAEAWGLSEEDSFDYVSDYRVYEKIQDLAQQDVKAAYGELPASCDKAVSDLGKAVGADDILSR